MRKPLMTKAFREVKSKHDAWLRKQSSAYRRYHKAGGNPDDWSFKEDRSYTRSSIKIRVMLPGKGVRVFSLTGPEFDALRFSDGERVYAKQRPNSLRKQTVEGLIRKRLVRHDVPGRLLTASGKAAVSAIKSIEAGQRRMRPLMLLGARALRPSAAYRSLMSGDPPRRLKGQEITAMARRLSLRGYAHPMMYARRLFREGMGITELETRLAREKGTMGSLEVTHGFKRARRSAKQR